MRLARAVPVLGFLFAATLAVSCSSSSTSESTFACSAGERSVATVWNEALLDAIRRDFPAPTVHARNLFHVSAAMWDSWAAFDPNASGVFVTEDLSADDVENARNVAISFAAHRVLSERYADADGGEESLAQFDETLESLCPGWTEPADDSPGGAGLRFAEGILALTIDDGALESEAYFDETYSPFNEPLIVSELGTTMEDPNRWQPLFLDERSTRNGIEVEAGTQEYIGPHWGVVEPFALDPDPDGLPIDPGPPPLLPSDAEAFAAAATEVVRYASVLDTDDSELIDISPATQGNLELGTYEPAGWDENPITGEPYAPNMVLEADFGRVIAEFWADGPDSETPPGHWNTIANQVGDDLEAAGELTIDGAAVDRLEWDVKVGLALNGAMHDTAIAVWGTKAHYDYARPISMIRYLGERGELVETPGLVETITEESVADGGPHALFASNVGEQVVYAWLGEPQTPSAEISGVGWQLATEWVPYQRASFVSPAFAGYVSGHSGFSRAGAEVLTELTGSAFFPGGMQIHEISLRSLSHEVGPSEAFNLQWATYRDAADQAAISRLYGGIHVRADDLNGRIIGEEVGLLVVEHARSYFGTS